MTPPDVDTHLDREHVLDERSTAQTRVQVRFFYYCTDAIRVPFQDLTASYEQ